MFNFAILLLIPLAAAQYDYGEVIHDSILFYEAQRTGQLPDDNRIPWRGDCCEDDGDDVGVDLTGGWFDAGDHVKFGFPMSATVTMLAWGLLEYEDGYRAAGEYDRALDSIRWPLDYFLIAHVSDNEFYGQVGDGHVDHAWWGRPEEMTMYRPAWSIYAPDGAGSDLAGETAAAFAASSMVFRGTDPSYADTLLAHARTMYDFAYNYRGIYVDTIENARSFYNSFSGYQDELCWGAAWLYYATEEQQYLDMAYEFTDRRPGDRVSWDDKHEPCHLLMYKHTGEQSHFTEVNNLLNYWFPGGSIQYTPLGLAWIEQWGPLRYAANMAFFALLAADEGIQPETGREFAINQIHYALGDTGRSFVVGYGNNPPQRPHHRAASCEDPPAVCDWNDYHKPDPNGNVLTGALVGGPDANDNYEDDREDYIANEVACDYNSGFQGALAGLNSLRVKGLL